jgi:aspartyl-tRNA(Asn)/glutamyl-tRNA(Gln) amidotransferase subunit C
MATISKQHVEHIASLARIRLTKEEIARFSDQLSVIFDYIETLNELDTKGVEPLSHVTGLTNVTREDIARPSELTDKLIEQMPESADRYLRVKGIL